MPRRHHLCSSILDIKQDYLSAHSSEEERGRAGRVGRCCKAAGDVSSTGKACLVHAVYQALSRPLDWTLTWLFNSLEKRGSILGVLNTGKHAPFILFVSQALGRLD